MSCPLSEVKSRPLVPARAQAGSDALWVTGRHSWFQQGFSVAIAGVSQRGGHHEWSRGGAILLR